MGKIKVNINYGIEFIKKKSIKKAFAVYMAAGLISGLVLSVLSISLCEGVQAKLVEKYREEYQKSLTVRELEYEDAPAGLGSVFITTKSITELLTTGELMTYNILEFLTLGLVPVWFVLSIAATSILFYRRRLQRPLVILRGATQNIAENNLDFTVDTVMEDELGELCGSFEKMRASLQDTYYEMWRQMEDRRQLNAAFAHDLRTPLTVLKGQNEMLIKYLPEGRITVEKAVSTARTMKKHIIRLEGYVTAMNEQQRLEDIAIEKRSVSREELREQLAETGKLVCREKRFVLHECGAEWDSVEIDLSAVLQVYENLLSNAARYAKEQVTVTLEGVPRCTLTVSDDGKGFSARDLKDAVKPYYRAAEKPDAVHMGLGLHICKLLCEKHGGNLVLQNEGGGKVKAVF